MKIREKTSTKTLGDQLLCPTPVMLVVVIPPRHAGGDPMRLNDLPRGVRANVSVEVEACDYHQKT
jgi:hypothetical protein